MSITLVERLRAISLPVDMFGRESARTAIHEAADYIAAQSRTIKLLGNDLDSARVEIARLESQLAGLAKPAPTGFLGEP